MSTCIHHSYNSDHKNACAAYTSFRKTFYVNGSGRKWQSESPSPSPTIVIHCEYSTKLQRNSFCFFVTFVLLFIKHVTKCLVQLKSVVHYFVSAYSLYDIMVTENRYFLKVPLKEVACSVLPSIFFKIPNIVRKLMYLRHFKHVRLHRAEYINSTSFKLKMCAMEHRLPKPYTMQLQILQLLKL